MKVLGIIMVVVSAVLSIAVAYYWHKINNE